MEQESPTKLSEKILATFKKNLLLSGVFILGVIFLSIGLIQFFNKPKQDIEFTSGENVMGASSSAQKIFVDVSGEVQKPGLYELKSDSRIQDALVSAGGLSSTADREFVSRSINLALKVQDGMKIYIPKAGDVNSNPVVGVSSPTTNTSGISVPGQQSGLISINSGSQSELESLPGIGPVTAVKIINLRPYSSIEELLSKKAVGQSVYGKIKDLLSL